MVRSLLSVVAVALATLLSACCPEDPFIPTRTIDTTIKHPAFLRIVHAAADAPAAAAVLGGQPFRPALPYLTFQTGVNYAQYYPADTSWKSVGFLGGGTILATAPIEMKAGAFYTAYLHGRAPDYRVLVTTDTVQAPPEFDRLKVRLVNLAPDAPPVDMYLTSSPDDPIALNLAYGAASPYSLRGPADLGRPGMSVIRAGSKDTLLAYPADLLLLFGQATLTLVMSGLVEPAGTEPMLSFAAFPEFAFDSETGLYGSPPLRLSLVGIRLINLVLAPSWQSLDLALWEAGFPENDEYRRNYAGQYQVKFVPSLVHPDNQPKNYFLQSAAKTSWRYRIERNSRLDWDPKAQVPISAPDTLSTQANQRYTVVVYGPDTNLRVRTAELNDDVPAPSPGQARLRFFHGGYGTLDTRSLRLRVGAAQSALQSYGQVPTEAMAFDVPAGAVTLEVVDENGVVVASTQATLDGGIAHTVFFAPNGNGVDWVIRPVADRVRR